MGSSDTDWLDVAGKIALGVGVGALATAGAVAIAKSGVVQSAVAGLRRKLDGNRLIDAPPPGTPLLVSLARGGAEHSGVFLGRSRVAELRGDGNICNASLSDFINGDADDPMNVRSGTRIFAACDDKTGIPLSSANVVAAARRFIKNVKKVSYNLFCNNCHVFTASCVEGNMEREQSFLDWVRDGTFSIDRLDEIISKVMNSGRNIAWIGVRGSTRGFIYNLNEEKIDRLESEGRSLWA